MTSLPSPFHPRSGASRTVLVGSPRPPSTIMLTHSGVAATPHWHPGPAGLHLAFDTTDISAVDLAEAAAVVLAVRRVRPQSAGTGRTAVVPLLSPAVDRGRLVWTVGPISLHSLSATTVHLLLDGDTTSPAPMPLTPEQGWELARALVSLHAWQLHLAAQFREVAEQLRCSLQAEQSAAADHVSGVLCDR